MAPTYDPSVEALEPLQLSEPGKALPLEFAVAAVATNLRIHELPGSLVCLDEQRSFGGSLDQADTRFDHYREVIERSIRRVEHIRPRPRVSATDKA